MAAKESSSPVLSIFMLRESWDERRGRAESATAGDQEQLTSIFVSRPGKNDQSKASVLVSYRPYREKKLGCLTHLLSLIVGGQANFMLRRDTKGVSGKLYD